MSAKTLSCDAAYHAVICQKKCLIHHQDDNLFLQKQIYPTQKAQIFYTSVILKKDFCNNQPLKQICKIYRKIGKVNILVLFHKDL